MTEQRYALDLQECLIDIPYGFCCSTVTGHYYSIEPLDDIPVFTWSCPLHVEAFVNTSARPWHYVIDQKTKCFTTVKIGKIFYS